MRCLLIIKYIGHKSDRSHYYIIVVWVIWMVTHVKMYICIIKHCLLEFLNYVEDRRLKYHYKKWILEQPLSSVALSSLFAEGNPQQALLMPNVESVCFALDTALYIELTYCYHYVSYTKCCSCVQRVIGPWPANPESVTSSEIHFLSSESYVSLLRHNLKRVKIKFLCMPRVTPIIQTAQFKWNVNTKTFLEVLRGLKPDVAF